MQTGCWLIENIQRLARVTLRKFGGKLHALALTTRERRAALPELYISKPDLLQALYLLQYVGHVLKNSTAWFMVMSRTSAIDLPL